MSRILRLPANTLGHDYYVTDVHGHFPDLRAILVAAGFNPLTDRCLSGGDLVDRGPHSAQVLDYLQELWSFSVKGNHEEMLLESVKEASSKDFHCKYGGLWFHESGFDQQPYINALEALPLAIELKLGNATIGIVHADVGGHDWPCFLEKLQGPDTATDTELYRNVALWSRERILNNRDSPVSNVDLVLLGHSIVEEVRFYGPNVLAMDTGCAKGATKGGRMSVLNLHTRQLYSRDLATGALTVEIFNLPQLQE